MVEGKPSVRNGDTKCSTMSEHSCVQELIVAPQISNKNKPTKIFQHKIRAMEQKLIANIFGTALLFFRRGASITS